MPQNALLLGMGAGSVVDILRNEYGLDIAITAVEYDPMVVQIAHDHFNISQYSKLEIVTASAFDYIEENYQKFDLVVVDIFTDIIMPQETLATSFIKNLIKCTAVLGYLVINYIIKSREQTAQLKLVFQLLSKNGELRTFQSGTNCILIWRNTH